jgi:hypothetical protein
MNRRQISRSCTLEAVAAWDNLFLAAAKARRGKSRRPDVEEWWLGRENHLRHLREALLTGAYQPGGYRFFEIFEPKRRLIAAAPFEDRVVHHALCNVLAPVLERRFIARSFSCQKDKGTMAARECCRRLTNRHAFVLKCDVRKFFPNIDHTVLFDRLAALVPCPGILELIRKIVASFRTGDDVAAPLFANDDLAEAAARPRGVPIGNLTSQLWGNFYLDELDHWVTEDQRHGAYLRYTDDFVLFDDDKARLWELRAGIVEQLARVRLKLAEPKSRLLATREGVPFCGFCFRPGLRPRILGGTKRRFESRRYGLVRRREPLARLGLAIFSWYQFSREGNSEGLRRAYGRWPLEARLKRRQRKSARVVRGGSWNNDNPDNFLGSNRNNNDPDNRNDNNGFRCAGDVGVGFSPKAGTMGVMPGGNPLPGRSQEASLNAVPTPVGATGKDAARAVAGNSIVERTSRPALPHVKQLRKLVAPNAQPSNPER